MAEQKRSNPATAAKISISPQEKLMEVASNRGSMFIGVPRENSFQENRISLTPEAVSVLVANGHRVVIETKAGDGAHFYDNDFSEAGAQIADSPEEVFKANILIKTTPLSQTEIGMLHPNQIVISPIHLPSLTENYVNAMLQKKVTALAFEYIKDDSNTFPIVRSMSEIAGSAGILIAAELLGNKQNGKGILLGGISGVAPAKVVVLGAGVAGEFAARTALGLGAEVKIFDNSIYKLMRLQNNVGSRIYTSIISPVTLMKELEDADVAVGAVHSEEGRTPVLVTEDMVSKMKAGSVIIDISIDQGGCFETSELMNHDKPTFKKFDVIHYCVPNIASRVPRTASQAISNVIAPQLLEAASLGGFEQLLFSNGNTRHGVYVFKGILTNQHLSEKFNLKFTNLDLLFAANV